MTEDNKSMMTKQSAEAYQIKYYNCFVLSLMDFYELADQVLHAYPNVQAWRNHTHRGQK